MCVCFVFFNCFLSVPILNSYNFAIMWCMYGKKVETSFHSFVYFLWGQVHTLLVYWQSISVTLLLLLIVPGCPLLSLFQWSGLSDGLDTKGKTLPKNTQQVNLVGKKSFKANFNLFLCGFGMAGFCFFGGVFFFG